MRIVALTVMMAVATGLWGACGDEESTNNAASNNGGDNNGAALSGSCFHNCVSQGPLGNIESFGCVAPSSTGDCATDGQDHCVSAGLGMMTASEYVADCASCDESCAPDFYDCSSATCITNTN